MGAGCVDKRQRKIYTRNRGKMQSCPCGIPEKKHRVVFPRQVNSESVVFVIVNTCAAAAVGDIFPSVARRGQRRHISSLTISQGWFSRLPAYIQTNLRRISCFVYSTLDTPKIVNLNRCITKQRTILFHPVSMSYVQTALVT